MAKLKEGPVHQGLFFSIVLKTYFYLTSVYLKKQTLQTKIDFKKWLEPCKNPDLYGISYPCVLIWSWKEVEGKMLPSFGWKCHM